MSNYYFSSWLFLLMLGGGMLGFMMLAS